LREIRDKKGYKLQYETFEEYCQLRWGFNASSAYKQMRSSETMSLIKNVSPGTQNITEKQIRPITTLPLTEQVNFVQTHDIAEMTSREVELWRKNLL